MFRKSRILFTISDGVIRSGIYYVFCVCIKSTNYAISIQTKNDDVIYDGVLNITRIIVKIVATETYDGERDTAFRDFHLKIIIFWIVCCVCSFALWIMTTNTPRSILIYRHSPLILCSFWNILCGYNIESRIQFCACMTETFGWCNPIQHFQELTPFKRALRWWQEIYMLCLM